MDKGLLFLVLALTCFWLILGQVYGDKPVTKFLLKVMPNAEKSGWWDVF